LQFTPDLLPGDLTGTDIYDLLHTINNAWHKKPAKKATDGDSLIPLYPQST
jgi:MoxR-like ATPase